MAVYIWQFYLWSFDFSHVSTTVPIPAYLQCACVGMPGRPIKAKTNKQKVGLISLQCRPITLEVINLLAVVILQWFILVCGWENLTHCFALIGNSKPQPFGWRRKCNRMIMLLVQPLHNLNCSREGKNLKGDQPILFRTRSTREVSGLEMVDRVHRLEVDGTLRCRKRILKLTSNLKIKQYEFYSISEDGRTR